MKMTVAQGFGLVADDALVLAEFLPFRLSVTADAVTRMIARACEDRFGMSVSASRVLCVLAETDRPNLPMLAARASVEIERMDGVLAELIDRGLVARDTASGATLTEAGRTLQADLGGLALAAEAALLTSLAPDDVRTLHRLLGRLEAQALKLSGRAA